MNKTLSVTMVSLEMLEHFLKLCEASYTVGTGVEFSFHSLWLRLGRLPHLPKHPVGRQDCCVWIRRSCFAVELHSSSDRELDAPKVLILLPELPQLCHPLSQNVARDLERIACLVSDLEQIYVVQYQQIFLHPCCFHLNQIEPLELVHLFCCCMVVRDHIVTYNASVAHWQSFQAATDTVVAFAHHLKNGHLAVGFRLTVHRQKYESITLHPNLFPEMKGVNLLLKTHRNNDKSNLKLKTVLQELLHVDIFSWQTKPSFFSSHPIHLVCL